MSQISFGPKPIKEKARGRLSFIEIRDLTVVRPTK